MHSEPIASYFFTTFFSRVFIVATTSVDWYEHQSYDLFRALINGCTVLIDRRLCSQAHTLLLLNSRKIARRKKALITVLLTVMYAHAGRQRTRLLAQRGLQEQWRVCQPRRTRWRAARRSWWRRRTRARRPRRPRWPGSRPRAAPWPPPPPRSSPPSRPAPRSCWSKVRGHVITSRRHYRETGGERQTKKIFLAKIPRF